MLVQNLEFSEVNRGQPEAAVIWAAAVGSATPYNLAFKSTLPRDPAYAIELGLAYGVAKTA